MLPYLPMALGLGGLLGGSAVGQVIDRPRRFLYEDLPEAFGYGGVSGFGEALERSTGIGRLLNELGQDSEPDRMRSATQMHAFSPPPPPDPEAQFRAGLENPVVRAVGFVGDILTDPLTFIGGGVGAGVGKAVQRLDRAVDAANTSRAAFVAPLAREAEALRAVGDMAGTAVATDAALVASRHQDRIDGIRQALAAAPPAVPGPPRVVATMPHGPIRTIDDVAAAATDPFNAGSVYDPAIMSALDASVGRKFLPRTYTPSAGQPNLPSQLDSLGIGEVAAGNRVTLPIPPGSGMNDLLEVRGGRLFGGPAVESPVVTPIFGNPPVENPEVGRLAAMLREATEAVPVTPDLSLASSAMLDPRTAAFARLNTPGLVSPAGHMIDLPMSQLIPAASAQLEVAMAKLAASLEGAPSGLSPLGRLWYRLAGKRPLAPDLGGFVPGNPMFDPIASPPPPTRFSPFAG